MYKIIFVFFLVPVSTLAQQLPSQKELNHQLAQMWGKQYCEKGYLPTIEELSNLLAQGADHNHIIDTHYNETLLDKCSYDDKYVE